MDFVVTKKALQDEEDKSNEQFNLENSPKMDS
jgi:hypothetical protein